VPPPLPDHWRQPEAVDLAKLKAERAAAHPDRCGSNAAFIEAPRPAAPPAGRGAGSVPAPDWPCAAGAALSASSSRSGLIASMATPPLSTRARQPHGGRVRFSSNRDSGPTPITSSARPRVRPDQALGSFAFG
jgi:hypothetical protein